MDSLYEILFFVAFIAVSVFIDKMNKKAKAPAAEPPLDHYPMPAGQVAAARPKNKRTRVSPTPSHDKSRGLQTPDAPRGEERPPLSSSEYDIRSAQDMRRAIIWSEILHRKY